MKPFQSSRWVTSPYTKQIVDAVPKEPNCYAAQIAPNGQSAVFGVLIVAAISRACTNEVLEHESKASQRKHCAFNYLLPLITSSNLNGAYVGLSHMNAGLSCIPRF